MGVQQFLQKVLPTAGQAIDLRHYGDGVYEGRRSLRVAVDIAAVVYQATTGFGDMLADERHLDNYGRAELRRQEKEAAAASSANKDTTTINNANNNAPHKRPTPNPQYDPQVQHYVHRCTQHVMRFLHEFQRVNVLVVLDGATPPCKQAVVQQRRQTRQVAQQARDAVVDEIDLSTRLTANRRAGAGPHFSLVLDAVVAALRAARIPLLVAPYESDGQLAFLSARRYVDLVVTEDSDLLAMGATPVLYKATARQHKNEYRDGIQGTLLSMDNLALCRGLSLLDFSSAMLAVVFIAAGSDYCEKLKGVGIVTATDAARKAFFQTKGQPPLQSFLQEIFRATYRNDLTDEYKAAYEERFLGALLQFRHPVVYDPLQGQCVTFRLDCPDPELILYEPYAALVHDAARRAKFTGTRWPAPLCSHVAEGWLDPRTLKPRQYARLPVAVETAWQEWKQQKEVVANPTEEVKRQEEEEEEEEVVAAQNGADKDAVDKDATMTEAVTTSTTETVMNETPPATQDPTTVAAQTTPKEGSTKDMPIWLD